MTYVDGNALAGALAVAFGREMTDAQGVCNNCGDRHRLAETRVYLRCPGMVMRCPRCANAEIVLVEIEHHLQLTVRGLASIALGETTTT
jgi:hypothetical protein